MPAERRHLKNRNTIIGNTLFCNPGYSRVAEFASSNSSLVFCLGYFLGRLEALRWPIRVQTFSFWAYATGITYCVKEFIFSCAWIATRNRFAYRRNPIAHYIKTNLPFNSPVEKCDIIAAAYERVHRLEILSEAQYIYCTLKASDFWTD